MSLPEAEAKVNKVTKTTVSSPRIYSPVGPYSQAVLANNSMLFVSGTLGLDSQARLVAGGAAAQARQALDNIRNVLEAGGASLRSVIKTTILLTDIDDFQAVNQVYAEYFPTESPARATYEVRRLPKDACVEIEAVALSGELTVDHAAPTASSRI